MNYYVISPNVKNNNEIQNWKNLILESHNAYIGWDVDHQKGRTFSNIEIGDMILIAQGANRNKELYLCGIADSNAIWCEDENMPSEAQKILLKNVITQEHLASINLDFNGCTYLDANRISAIYKLKPKSNENDEKVVNKFMKEIKKMESIEYYNNILLKNKNIILTGAPGTGKTYLAKEIANQLILSKSITTNNPNDILKKAIDEFNPDNKKRNKYKRLLRSFHEKFPKEDLQSLNLDNYCIGKGDQDNFCWWIERGLSQLGIYFPGPKGAFVYGIYYNKELDEFKKRKIFQDKNEDETLEMITKSISHAFEDNDKAKEELKKKYYDPGFLLKILNSYEVEEILPIFSLNHIDNIIDLFSISITPKANPIDKAQALYDFYKKIKNNKDIDPYEFISILYSNFNIKKGELKNENQEIILTGDSEFVQFHPSYDYTDFVEGLRPVKKAEDSDIGFELRNGIFKEFCQKAKDNPNKNFVFIIDEINRGEISKIFGELFFCIDPGYRGEKGKVNTQYKNIQNQETYFTSLENDNFYVPENVFIIGTMNDIDRSVESFDFAMRRRFAWLEIEARERTSMWDGQIDNWKEEAQKRMESLNNAIADTEGLSSSYHIGPAYFLKLSEYDGSFEQLWKYHIKMLLSEYLRGMPDASEKLERLENAYFELKVENENN